MALHLLFRKESTEVEAAVASDPAAVRIWLGDGASPSPPAITLPRATDPSSDDCRHLLEEVLSSGRIYVW